MTRPELTLAHSPDPDDAFMWWPITGKVAPRAGANGHFEVLSPPVIDTGRFRFCAVPADIEALNRLAAGPAPYDVTAISFRTYCDVKDRYAVTACGSSFGEGFGPKLVCRADQSRDAVRVSGEDCLRRPEVRIAIPGVRTTAFLMLAMVLGREGLEPRSRLVEMAFDRVIPAVAAGDAEAGLVIHEGQLMFAEAGLRLLLDVGAWWRERTGLPLPLGANAIKRDLDVRLGPGTMVEVAATLRASIDYALAHRAESLAYAGGFALANSTQSRTAVPDADRIDRYVSMYVNRWTVDMGEAGLAAVQRLLDQGFSLGLCPDPGRVDPVGTSRKSL